MNENRNPQKDLNIKPWGGGVTQEKNVNNRLENMSRRRKEENGKEI
jgi:hypothetical protein